MTTIKLLVKKPQMNKIKTGTSLVQNALRAIPTGLVSETAVLNFGNFGGVPHSTIEIKARKKVQATAAAKIFVKRYKASGHGVKIYEFLGENEDGTLRMAIC